MDEQLVCLIVEAAFREGIKSGVERCAVAVDGTMRVGHQSLQEALVSIDFEALDCYSITVRCARLSRLMLQLRKG